MFLEKNFILIFIGRFLYAKFQFQSSAVFSGGDGGARAPLEFGGSQKGQSLISAYQSLAITMNTPGFEKLEGGASNLQLG